MTINLDDLSLKELKELNNRTAKAIANFHDRHRRAALAEIEELARAKGFTLSELAGIAAPRKRAPAVAKYANPADKSDTWSGRGRKPRWFVAALKSGKSPEDLAI
ncbi:MAG: H-NS family nucleoid-associated regulatory protein [Bryobacteraceae bacterium]